MVLQIIAPSLPYCTKCAQADSHASLEPRKARGCKRAGILLRSALGQEMSPGYAGTEATSALISHEWRLRVGERPSESRRSL